MSRHFHVRIPSALLERADRTPVQKLVLAYLAFRIGRIGQTWRSQPRMAEELGVGERTLRRTVAELVALGDVEIVVHGRGRTRTNSYAIKQEKLTGFLKQDNLAGFAPENRPKVVKKTGGFGRQKGTVKKNRVESAHFSHRRASVEGSPVADSPPTIKAVAAYAKSIGYNVLDAAKFVDHYTSNGWRVGRSPMRDWEAAVRNWQRRDAQGSGKTAEPEDAHDPDEEKADRLLGFGGDQGGGV